MFRKIFIILLKEWRDLSRSKGMMIFIFYIFMVDVYIAGQGINIDAKNVNIGILDEAGSSFYVGKIVSKLHEPEFGDIFYYHDRGKLFSDIKNKKILAGLVFPEDFDRNFADGKKTDIQLLLDSTVAVISYFVYTYIVNIISEIQLQQNLRVPVQLDIHKLFNPNASAIPLFSLRELVFAVTLLSIMLSATVFVKEREQETWDLMLLVPVDNKIMIFSKILSQIVIINVGFYCTLGIIIFGVFGVQTDGNVLAFLLLTLLYTITMSGLGLFIAAIAKNMAQVGMFSILAIIPMDFLSEGFTPLSVKPLVMQWLSYLSPMRYYTIGMGNLVFRGSDVVYSWPEFLGLFIIALLVFTIGIKKLGRLF